MHQGQKRACITVFFCSVQEMSLIVVAFPPGSEDRTGPDRREDRTGPHREGGGPRKLTASVLVGSEKSGFFLLLIL